MVPESRQTAKTPERGTSPASWGTPERTPSRASRMAEAFTSSSTAAARSMIKPMPQLSRYTGLPRKRRSSFFSRVLPRPEALSVPPRYSAFFAPRSVVVMAIKLRVRMI